MNGSRPDALQLYFSRLQPIYRELFGMAHAICGNYELAEYALQRAMLEGWTQRERLRRRLGFREGMRETLRQISLQEALRNRDEPPEFTWDGLRGTLEGDELASPEDELILREMLGESLELRRELMLRYGCALNPREIGKLTGISAGQVRSQLERFEARTRRKLPARNKRRFETALTRLAREELHETRENLPDLGTVYRTLEVEASQDRQPRKYISRAVNALIFAALAVLCALLFWLVAVLMQPPRLEQEGVAAPAQAAYEIIEGPSAGDRRIENGGRA